MHSDFVEVEWLASRLGDPRVRIVDARSVPHGAPVRMPPGREQFAAGDGALRTCTTPSEPWNTKSSTSPPSAVIACARTPAGPGRQSSGSSSGM